MSSESSSSPQPPLPAQAVAHAPRRRRPSLLDVLRGLFLVAAVGFGWWGLREYHAQILEALGQTSVVRVLACLVVVLVGLALTGVVWRTLLAGFGHTVASRPASSIFFVGQLGKYIPGSVWSLGAQADMARRHCVPARTTVSVGLVFLWVHVISALPVALLLGPRGTRSSETPVLLPASVDGWITDPPGWVVWGGCAVSLLLLSPVVLGWVGTLLAGRGQPLSLGWSSSARLLVLMAFVWVLYGLGLALVIPPPVLESAGGLATLLAPVTAAFAAAYLVGVLVVLAPAGAGVRELTVIALLEPVLGLPSAAAAALLMRLVHTIADFAVAGIAWLAARPAHATRSPTRRSPGDSSSHDSDVG